MCLLNVTFSQPPAAVLAKEAEAATIALVELNRN
jgi:hypothetical protein